MIHFEWPWAFSALLLPWLVYRLLPAAATTHDAPLRVPFAADFSCAAQSPGRQSARRPALWLAMTAWLLLVTAAARPQWLGEPVELPISGRDLMLAVDLSGSMEVEDFRLNGRLVNRLQATKAVAGKFIERRIGDRIGLILFGRQAYLQTPLTFDRRTVHTLLMEAAIGLAGQETAIGDAIGLAVKRLQDHPAQSRVLVLLTDGANTAGEIEPLRAAELAAGKGLKIYTIGIGADELLVSSLFGQRRINPSAELDEKTLRAIATTTGGRYFRATDLQALEKIYRLLDELEPVDQQTQLFRPLQALYPWPLSLALLCATLLILGRYSGKL